MTSIAVIVGSGREASYNRALGELAAASLEAQGASVTRVDLAAFDLPLYSARSEEHTSELQSLMRISYAVFCLKNIKTMTYNIVHTDHTRRYSRLLPTADSMLQQL